MSHVVDSGVLDAATVDDRAQALLEQLAGPTAVLRPDQATAIRALVVDRRRCLVVQRTGWGKSAVYFLATRLLREAGAGPTLLVSPLLALMRDQVAAATRVGLRARTINSTNVGDWEAVADEVAADEVDLLLVSPERLNNPTFRRDVLPRVAAAVGLLVVDEAHCISDWGHDFRPDYRRIRAVLADLGEGVPVLATTATANGRVVADVAEQLEGGLGAGAQPPLVLRGPLERESLALSAHRLPSQADRLAWLVEHLPRFDGSGIVYCLTTADCERVATFLVAHGVRAVAYSGEVDAPLREVIEADLQANRVKAVVATSALGMGFDKGDLAWVVHLQSPPSPIAYYQQVGRAGRAIPSARAVLLRGAEDARVWAWFDSLSFPPEHQVRTVLSALGRRGPLSVPALEPIVDLRRTRLEALLKVLDVEGVVTRGPAGWAATGVPYVHDEERHARVAQARRDEQAAMDAYVDLPAGSCRMAFLRRALDDDLAEPCGRCDLCTGTAEVAPAVDPALAAAAQAHLGSAEVVLEPRKQWPSGLGDGFPKGRLRHAAAGGRALADVGVGGWGPQVRALLDGPDGPLPADLDAAVIATLRRWAWVERPRWVTWVPSRARPQLVASLAERIGALGKLPVVPSLARAAETPPQADQANSAFQARNALGGLRLAGDDDGASLPAGPVLVVDDVVRSGWTMAVAAHLLGAAGVGPVLPFALLSG